MNPGQFACSQFCITIGFFLDTLFFDILYRLGVDHQRDRQTERQTAEMEPGQQY